MPAAEQRDLTPESVTHFARHVAPRCGAEHLAKYGHEAGHAFVAQIGRNVPDGRTSGKLLRGTHDARLLAPAVEGHACFLAD